MANNEAIFEIGNIVKVRNNWKRRILAEEIVNSPEYQEFKYQYPELCRLAEELNSFEEPSSEQYPL